MFYLLCIFITANIPFINCDEIKNIKVHRRVDLRNQVIIFIDEIEFLNIGSNRAHEYKYVLDPSIEKARLQVNNMYLKEHNRTYLIKFEKGVLPNERFTFDVTLIVLDELPILNIRQSHRFVSYNGNLHYYSAYETDRYTVLYELFQKAEVVEMEPKIGGNKTSLFDDVNEIHPYSYTPFSMIYINDGPFYFVTNLERKIDVSHFGFIMVEDKVFVRNKGPKPKEPYRSLPGHARTKLHTLLPDLAFNVKLFDEIGNNSKSHLFYHTEYGTLLAFETRYELLMSWKTIYIIRYTVPAYPYLQRANNTYLLTMPLVDDVLPGAFIKHSRTKVYLPEDAKLMAVNKTEDSVKVGDPEVVTTALAPLRQAVVFDSIDLVNGFTPSFQIVYTRGSFRVFKPAFYIITYIESVFLCYLFVSYTKPVLSLRKY